MLELTISGTEAWNEGKQEFVYTKPCVLTLEHSLISVSKWESKWHKPYLSAKKLTLEESIDYIKCMTIGKIPDQSVYDCLSRDDFSKINDYISDPMSATYFKKNGPGGSNEKIVSELIYYWMISLGIPFECEKWHLNRLLALIQVCNRKNNPTKMSSRELAERNAAINKARRAATHSKG